MKSVLTLLAATALTASASTLSIGKGLGAGVAVQRADGSYLGPGSFQIVAGTFLVDPPPAVTIGSLMSGFSEFGRALTDVDVDAKGLIALSTGITAFPANAASLNLRPVYLLIGNAAVFENSTEIAVIKALNPSQGTWTFPNNVQALDLANAPMTGAASFQPAGTGGKLDNLSGPDAVILAPVVPEPGAGILLLAAIGVTSRRRTRRA